MNTHMAIAFAFFGVISDCLSDEACVHAHQVWVTRLPASAHRINIIQRPGMSSLSSKF